MGINSDSDQAYTPPSFDRIGDYKCDSDTLYDVMCEL